MNRLTYPGTQVAATVLSIVLLAGCDGGNTPGDLLLSAADNGDVEAIQEQLAAGADVDYTNPGFLSSEETACMKAAKSGQLQALKYLVETAGADFRKATSGGENPITLAAKAGQADIVLYLVERGEDINYQEGNYGKTALLHAAEHGDLDFVIKLMAKGASLNVRDKTGNTPLTTAVMYKKPDVVRHFLHLGGNPNERGIYGRPALHLAVTSHKKNMLDLDSGMKDIIDMLLSAGADINAQDSDGNTAMITAGAGGQLAVMNYLKSKGADPSIRNNAGADASGAYSSRKR